MRRIAPTRLALQKVGQPFALRMLTPPTDYVDALSWSPDGREIAYSAAPRTGFTAAYDARVYAVALEGGARRTIVDRAGMNTGPRYSPDGQSIAFISTNGRNDIMASRSLTIVAAAGGTPEAFTLDDAWVNEYVWSRDSRSILLQANDGTFGRADHMFEQPVVRLSVADGRATRLGRGPDRRLLDQPQRRRHAAGVQVGRCADDGRRRGDGCGQRPRHDDHRRESRAAPTSRSAISSR